MTRRIAPPMREDPSAKSKDDGAIADHWMKWRWTPQDLMLLPRDRQIDENVRMVLGQQHLVWLPLLQRHFDVAEWFQEPDRRMRERVTVNHLLPWFVQTHARMSENPPILTWLPMADSADAETADALDRLHKWHYRRAGGPSVLAMAQAWSIVAGAGYVLTYVDPNKGPWKPWLAPGMVQIVGPDGEVLDQVEHPAVPYTKEGQQASQQMTPDGQFIPMQGPDGQPLVPHQTRRGDICFEGVSPLEIRGQWGPTPWYQKRWHMLRRWMSEGDIFHRFSVEVEQHGRAGTTPNDTIAQRVMFGSGHYPGGSIGFPGLVDSRTNPVGEPLHEVQFCWEAPGNENEGTAGGPQDAGGRYTVLIDGRQVVTDGPRPVPYPFTSPIHEFPFFRVPGRNWPASPQDPLNSPQRHLNKERTHVVMHTHLNAHPIALLDRGSGITRQQWTNEPGLALTVVRRSNVPAVELLGPPPLGEAVWRHGEMAARDIQELGMLLGTQGEPISPDQSGEAIKELRFNSDRYLGVALREQAEEVGRWGRTLAAHYPLIYDRDELIKVIGEDDAALTIHVYPELFNPEAFDVISDSESMLPESRSQRQERAMMWYTQGMFGMPGSFEAMQKYWEIARFPHHARAAQPGGADALTAKRFLGKLLQGAPWQSLPVFEWYANEVFVYVLEQELKSYRFIEHPPEIQNNLVMYYSQHQQMLQRKQMAQQAAQEQAMQRQMEMEAQTKAANPPASRKKTSSESADSRPAAASQPSP